MELKGKKKKKKVGIHIEIFESKYLMGERENESSTNSTTKKRTKPIICFLLEVKRDNAFQAQSRVYFDVNLWHACNYLKGEKYFNNHLDTHYDMWRMNEKILKR